MVQSTDLHSFQIPGEGSRLRVFVLDGEPWFAAADVARVLGYRDAANAVRVLKSGEKGPHRVSTPGGDQEILLISEPGFYRLVMRSNRPEADAFQTWVTGEVLPSIRRTGVYSRVQPQLPQTFAEALELAAKQARELEGAKEYANGLIEERNKLQIEVSTSKEVAARAEERRAAISATLGEALGVVKDLEPKAEGYDAFLSSVGAFPLATAASMLGTGRQTLIQVLGAWGVLILRPNTAEHLRPYADQIHAGNFTVKATDVAITHRDGSKEVITRGTTLVTPKGLDYIRRRGQREGAPWVLKSQAA